MTSHLTPQQIKKFQKHILDWYGVHKRDLPWRQTRDPYRILISEVMSQQTQISRVVPKYEAWISVFPTVWDLANASVRDVLFHWSGLGYNRRALYLKQCALVVSSRARNPDGISHDVRDDSYWYWPQTEKELMELPGIGKYTARAILCFAFGQQVAVVDTNVRRVILTQIKNSKVNSDQIGVKNQKLTEKEIEILAEQLVPKGKAYAWNQALMDYAAAELKHTKIPIPKQSRFKDSDRFVRGHIIKMLLRSSMLENRIYKEITKTMSLEKPRFLTIVKGLQKEGLIVKKNTLLMLP